MGRWQINRCFAISAFLSRLIVAAEIARSPACHRRVRVLRFRRPFFRPFLWASKEMGNEDIFLSITLDKNELHL